ncbi:TonB-dependent receptor plug domain-containing protein [Parachitinimonas caeni]|uniref:TonB-dependent receptor n=1 Tax=Parachitinimonas caeni TaxID=3031301 RepID=A0ABT7E3I8_9NEIS|nr:TonB-dependent receptor [Parachitinimonas caeni]MDK2126892.1 TonB-dependent receptor [Parachitinimonas caeni]
MPNYRKRNTVSILNGLAFFVSAAFAFAETNNQAGEEEDLSQVYGDNAFVSIATGSKQPIARAPAVATVITARDIEAIGETDLDEVLRLIPGMHASVSPLAYSPIYAIRGIHTKYNPQVLVLVNGLPVTDNFQGNRSFSWGGFPLENVARIEVIRGPGSALYGADAFSGVVNIITKNPSEMSGVNFGARAGSFDSKEAFLMHGGNYHGAEFSFFVKAGESDGQKEEILYDTQSTIDKLFGTKASLAPGAVSTSRRAFDARVEMKYKNLRARAGYQYRKVGIGAGLADAVDPYGRLPGRRTNWDITYNDQNLFEGWDISAQVSYFNVKDEPGDPGYMLFPPGAFGGAFPKGVIANPSHYVENTQVDLSAFYTGFEKHRVRLGAGYKKTDMYRTMEFKNFDIQTVPNIGPVFIPLGEIKNVSETAPYIRPHDRRLRYVFLQDEWSIAKDWVLTAGLRHDKYSDFGSTTNPRLALVWDVSYNLTFKALYGRAYRAPAFAELYNINNPVAIGNPNLKPEKISTGEVALSWQSTPSLQLGVNVYQYKMKDIIRFVPNADPSTGATAQNTGSQSGHGAEFETTWDINKTIRLTGNLSLQKSTDDTANKDAGGAPQRRVFVRGDWRFLPTWQSNLTVNWVADRAREPGDNRPEVKDYTLVDFSVRKEKLFGNWEMRGVVKNIFDTDAREPSPAPGNTLYDLPLAGRAFYIQLLGHF